MRLRYHLGVKMRMRLAAVALVVAGALQQSPDELKTIIHRDDWNPVHIIARGNTITQILNGAVTSIVIDDDVKNRMASGLLGFQMHVGDPMRVEFRNVWLRRLN